MANLCLGIELPATCAAVCGSDDITHSVPTQFVGLTLLESRKGGEVLSYLPQGEWGRGEAGQRFWRGAPLAAAHGSVQEAVDCFGATESASL